METLLSLVLVCLVGGGVGFLILLTIERLRSPVRSTRRRKAPSRSIDTGLSVAEVRERVAAVAAARGLRVVPADDPDRLVLVSKGIPFGRTGPGFFFPVYLLPGPGGTTVEVGVRRRVPAAAHMLEAPFEEMTGALTEAL